MALAWISEGQALDPLRHGLKHVGVTLRTEVQPLHAILR